MNTNVQDISVTKPRRAARTETLTKQLATHPVFKGLSERLIQRYLIPLYLEDDPAAELSVEAIVDHFQNNVGLGKVILDNFENLTRSQIKSLASNDDLFIEAVEAFLNDANILEPETDPTFDRLIADLWFMFEDLDPKSKDYQMFKSDLFNYYNKLVFNLNESKNNTKMTEATDTGLDKLFNSQEFKQPISDAEVQNIIQQHSMVVESLDEIEDFNEKTFNKLTEKYLKEVYSNVASFKTTSCSLKNTTLIIEGLITFNSGKSKSTIFEYTPTSFKNNKIILEGYNKEFSDMKAFSLNCRINSKNCLEANQFNYKYKINNTLVEGII